MKNSKIFTRIGRKPAAAAAAAGALALTAGNAFAQSNTITDLFGAVDISGVQAAVYTFLAALIGIGLLFFGRRLLAKLGVSI